MVISDRYEAPSFYAGGNTVAIGETDIWNEFFAETIDWKDGWKTYWDFAHSNFSPGTDFDPAVSKVELQIFHAGNGNRYNGAKCLRTTWPCGGFCCRYRVLKIHSIRQAYSNHYM